MMRNLLLVFGLIFSLLAQASIPTRLGDTEVLGYLKPGSSGIDLGSSVAQWDAYLQQLHLYNQSAGALYLDSGNSVASLPAVSLAELGYLDGVTSPIQTQLDAKLGTSLSTGYVYIGDASSVAQKRAVSGDVVVDQNGDAQIQAGKVANAEVAAGAAIVDTKLATIQTAGKVANSATTGSVASVANTLMLRDASGQVAASTFTGAVTGTASGNPPNARQILATAPMYGGGDLSSDRTLAMYQASASSNGYLGSSDYVTLMAKEPAISAGSSLAYWRGDKTFQTLNTAAVPELTNLYYTDVRARAALSASALPLSYNSGTGAFSIADASSTASGVFNTSAQEFAGQKDFQTFGLKQTSNSTTGNIDALTTTSFSSFRLTGAAPVLRGIGGGAAHRLIVIVNASGTAFSIKNQDSNPTAANRIITGTAADLSLADTASVVLQYDNASSRWRVVGGSGSGGGTASGNSLTSSVTQTTHGFAVGDLIYNTGSAYAKAKADAEATAEVLGIVTTVPTANTFTFTTAGELTGILSGLTPGAAYYLSGSSAGAYTATEPVTVGYISKPVFIAAGSSTAAFVIHSRGQVVTVATGGGRSEIVYSQTGLPGFGSTNTKVLKWSTNLKLTGSGLALNTSATSTQGNWVDVVTGGYCTVTFVYGDAVGTTNAGIVVDETGSQLSAGGATLTGNIRTLNWSQGRRASTLSSDGSGYKPIPWTGNLSAGARIYFLTNDPATNPNSDTTMTVACQH